MFSTYIYILFLYKHKLKLNLTLDWFCVVIVNIRFWVIKLVSVIYEYKSPISSDKLHTYEGYLTLPLS